MQLIYYLTLHQQFIYLLLCFYIETGENLAHQIRPPLMEIYISL